MSDVGGALAPLVEVLTPILQGTEEGVIVTDENGSILFCNLAAGNIFGDPPSGAGSWPALEGMFTADGRTPCRQEGSPLARVIAGQEVSPEIFLLRKALHGAETWLSVRGWPLRDGEGRTFAGVIIARDITEARKTLEELRFLRAQISHHEEERQAELLMVRDVMDEHGRQLDKVEDAYRQLFDRNPRPMWVFDAESLAFLAVNDAAVHHYGYSRDEFLGMTIRDIRPADDVTALQSDVHEPVRGLKSARAWRHRKKNGDILHVEVSRHEVIFEGRTARLVLIEDLTERHRLEQQLQQAQKMEAIGRLAGGIAHDFNNMLMAILSFASFAKESTPAGSPALGDLEEVLRAGRRASELTAQLLAFSRQQIVDPQVLDLNGMVMATDKMLRRTLGADVELVTLPASELWLTRIDAGKCEQVLMNLAINARDAMPAGGKLTIETANVILDEEYARRHAQAVAGEHVMVAVSDNGIGMDEATLARIFEPFFTTKPKGLGTGLGLATSYGIVKQAGGNIWVYSEPGRGTTLKIYLPRALPDGQQVEAPAKTVATPHGSEVILVAEDDTSVRASVVRTLKRLGYTVIEAAHAEDALKRATVPGQRIDLLLSDVVMPQVGGRELALRLRAWHPEMKVLFMSGYTDSAIVHHGEIDQGVAFLQKPFMPDLLGNKIRQVLDDVPNTPPGSAGATSP